MVKILSLKKLQGSHKEENPSITVDRLSELPDEVLIHILSFLPIECAVRTMLHRPFRDLWTFLPALKFDVHHSPKFISNVMKYHKNPSIDSWEYVGGCAQSKWVRAALKKKPKVLVVQFKEFWYQYGTFLEPLRHIFANRFIEILNLSNLHTNLPGLIGMRSLRRLDLFRVKITDGDLKVLELRCPCLQELSIGYPSHLNKVHFIAPNIIRLKLELSVENNNRQYSLDCPNLKFLHIEKVYLDNLEVIDVSSVSHAMINNYSPDTVHHFEILQGKFWNAKVLHIGDCDFLVSDALFVDHPDEYENYWLVGDKVCMQLQNAWSHLALKPGLKGSCLLSICRLLRMSRYLKELVVYANMDFFCDCNALAQELSSPCELHYLKTVTIHGFEKQCKAQVQLLKFLLKNALVLEKMSIFWNKKNGHRTSKKSSDFFLELLSSFPVASRNAEVVIA